MGFHMLVQIPFFKEHFFTFLTYKNLGMDFHMLCELALIMKNCITQITIKFTQLLSDLVFLLHVLFQSPWLLIYSTTFLTRKRLFLLKNFSFNRHILEGLNKFIFQKFSLRILIYKKKS